VIQPHFFPTCPTSVSSTKRPGTKIFSGGILHGMTYHHEFFQGLEKFFCLYRSSNFFGWITMREKK
jgi:hypothetical protein